MFPTQMVHNLLLFLIGFMLVFTLHTLPRQREGSRAAAVTMATPHSPLLANFSWCKRQREGEMHQQMHKHDNPVSLSASYRVPKTH